VDWNIVKRNPNTNDSAWSNFSFNDNFADANGDLVDVSVGLTLLMPLLSYQYDGRCGGLTATAAEAAQADTAALRKFLQAGAPPRLEILRRFEIRRGFTLSTLRPASAAIPMEPAAVRSMVERAGTERLLLTVGDIRQPMENSFFVRVFINLPTADPRTPTEDPHFAGSFAFFDDPKAMRDEQESGGAFIVDVSETIRRLSRAGEVRDEAPVQVRFVAVPIREGVQAADDTFGAGRLELALARVLEKK
jgi:tyrosinase